MSDSHPPDGLSEELSEELRTIVDDAEVSLGTEDSESEAPGWKTLEEIGAGDGPETECERCRKLGTPRKQFEHMASPSVLCTPMSASRSWELKNPGPSDNYEFKLSLGPAYSASGADSAD